jgi:uncharacterized protein (TIGR02246 family)
MKKQLLIIILTILCGVSASVAQEKRVRIAIEDNEAKFSAAFAKGDTAAVSNLYAEDAAILPPNGARIEGRANIKNFWQGAFEAGVKKVETQTLETSGSGDEVYEIGGYTLYGDENKMLDEGKYVVIWKLRGKNWLMFRDIWNSNRK